MPCDQYELHLQNSVLGPNANPDVAVASLDHSTSTVTAVQLGHINVVLDHKSILLTNYSSYCVDDVCGVCLSLQFSLAASLKAFECKECLAYPTARSLLSNQHT